MKNILIPIHTFYPGKKGGGPIKSISNLVNILNNEFNFYIYTNSYDYKSKENYKDIENNCWIKKDKYNIFYSKKKIFKLFQIINLLKKNQFDTIYLNSFFSYNFSILYIILIKILKINVKIVLAPRGELYPETLRIKKIKKKLYIFFSKLFSIYSFITWHATNSYEAEEIEKMFPKSDIVKINNMVSIENKYYNAHLKKGDVLKIVYLSRIHPHKNLKLIIEYLNDINFDVEFDIYGSIEDESYFKEIIKASRNLKKNINVSYQGSVPYDKALSKLKNYHLFTLLTNSENFGHAIFDSLSVGTPVLISNKTPFKNLEKKGIGKDIDIQKRKEFKNYLTYVNNLSTTNYELLVKKCFHYAENFSKTNNNPSKYIEILRNN